MLNPPSQALIDVAHTIGELVGVRLGLEAEGHPHNRYAFINEDDGTVLDVAAQEEELLNGGWVHVFALRAFSSALMLIGPWHAPPTEPEAPPPGEGGGNGEGEGEGEGEAKG